MLRRLVNKSMGALFLLVVCVKSYGAVFEVGRTREGDAYITMTGMINKKDGAKFAWLVEGWQKADRLPRLLILDSRGGDTIAHFVITDTVLKHNMNTAVKANKLCASACFTILAAGRHRFIDPTSRIGVHRAGLINGKENGDTREMTENIIKVYKGLGIPKTIQNKMQDTPARYISYLSQQEKEDLMLTPRGWEGEQTRIRIAGVITHVESLTPAHWKHTIALYERGTALIKQRSYWKAANLLEEANEQDPANADILRHLGIAYYKAGRYEKAKTALTAAVYRDADQPVAWRYLGLTLVALKDVPWAVDCFVFYWMSAENQTEATNQFLSWIQRHPKGNLFKAVKQAQARLGL